MRASAAFGREDSAGSTIMSMSPNQGPTGGGTLVTFTAANLAGTTAVKFGTKLATGVTQVSPTQVTAISPAGSGTVGVTVTTAGGTSAWPRGHWTRPRWSHSGPKPPMPSIPTGPFDRREAGWANVALGLGGSGAVLPGSGENAETGAGTTAGVDGGQVSVAARSGLQRQRRSEPLAVSRLVRVCSKRFRRSVRGDSDLAHGLSCAGALSIQVSPEQPCGIGGNRWQLRHVLQRCLSPQSHS